MKVLELISEVIAKVTLKLACFFLFLMSMRILAQVILRYVFNSGITSADEIAKYSIIWGVCLVGNILIREEALIKVDFLDQYWPPIFIKYRDKVYQILIIVLLVFLLKEGWIQAIDGLRTRLTSLDLPWFYPYLAVPVGALLMLYQSLFLLLKSFVNHRKSKATNQLNK